MAIENALIAKIGGGLVAASGATGTGIYYRTEIYDSLKGIFSNQKNEEKVSDVYVVVSKTTVASELIPTEEPNHTNRNFKCKSSIANLPEDETCEIYQLPPKEGKKLNDLTKISASSTIATKEKIKEGTYFKLKIKSNLLSDKGNETITLFSTKIGEETKKYGEFTVAYKIKENKFVGETDLLLVKATKNSGELTGTLKCKVSIKPETIEDCAIHKFSSAPTGNEYKNFDFSAPLTATTNKEDAKKDAYLVIDLKNQKHSIANLKGTTTITTIYLNGTTTNVGEFTFVAALAKTKDFATSTDNTFFLS